jgi:hypothetical protein
MTAYQLWAPASLHLTARARAVVLAAMAQISDFEPVACVTWALDQVVGEGAKARHLGAGWGLGFYSKTQVPSDAVTMIEGIPFVFDAQSASRLNDGELDFLDGRFVLNSSGPD